MGFGEDLNKEVAVLSPGDWVEFEATMLQHGHRGDPEIMMLWHVSIAPKPSPLSSSASGGFASQETKSPHLKPGSSIIQPLDHSKNESLVDEATLHNSLTAAEGNVALSKNKSTI